MQTDVEVNEVKEDAQAAFRSGEFFCSEAIVSTIRDHFELDISKRMIAMASGFPVGVGKSKCICGAVSGAVMAVSYFFGRTEGGDQRVERNLKLANELHDSFQDKHGCLCCRVLTSGMDMESNEHKEQCISFTGEMAAKATEIILRETKKDNTTLEEE
ncbi:MAG: C-GCAxxG-C-C family protein [Bacillota bacterium]